MSATIVTGSASGIGLATARLLKKAGHVVYGVDIQPTPSEAVDSYFVKDLAYGGVCPRERKIDLLVCSHGISGVNRSWEDILNVHVIGTKNMVEAVLPNMNYGGHIILVASMTGTTVGNKDMELTNYAAAKGAIAGYVRQLAVEVAERSIQVNAIAPGPAVTPMTDSLLQRDPEFYEEFFGRCLLPGKTTAEDIADAIGAMWLMPRMTGQTIVVDGGYTIW